MIHVLVDALWICTAALSAVLCVIMLRRNLHRDYPLFFLAVALEVIFDLSGLAVYKLLSYHAYFYYYWFFTLVEVFVGIGVIREIFTHVFRPYESLRKFGDVLFYWSALVLLIVATLMFVASAPASKIPLVNVTYALYRSMLLMECGLVIFMYLFAPHLGLTNRHRTFGISLGLGLMASCELIVFTVSGGFMSHHADLFNAIKGISAATAVSLWNWYMIQPEPERRASAFAHSEEWNYKLTEITHSNQDSAFLPSVVDTVERIMSRRVMTDEADVLGTPTTSQ